MKNIRYFAVLALVMASSCTMFSQVLTMASTQEGNLKWLEQELVPAAEAMPEAKFDFAPNSGEFKGVRTFAQQIKHVAAVNYIIAAAILGEKPPVDTGGEKGPETIKNKAEAVKFLRDSFAYSHRAFAVLNEKNALLPINDPFGGKKPATRLGLSTVLVAHCFDHYGQMVVYLRMNGIIPPASR